MSRNQQKSRSVVDSLLYNTNLPFTDRVMLFPLPEKFKVSHIKNYSGSEDPTEHIETFRSYLVLHGTPDGIACQAFPLTLKGSARDWLGKFSSKSIDNFDTLGRRFLLQFLVGRRRRNPSAYLLTVTQKEMESLRDYIIRFNQEKLTVEDQKDDMILAALLNSNSANCQLMVELARRPPSSLQAFMDKAEDFVNGEEGIDGISANPSELQTTPRQETQGSSNQVRE